MREGHALRPARAAARVQDQGDVVEARWIDVARGRDAGEAHRARGVHLDDEDGHLVAGGLARFLGAVRGQQQDLGVGVLEVEAEFLFFVSRIERRGGSGDACGEKRHDRRQPVRERRRDAVAALDARRGERAGDGVDLFPKVLVADPKILFRNDDGRAIGRDVVQEADESIRARW